MTQITDFQLILDDLRHNAEVQGKEAATPVPTFSKGDPVRPYQVYLPVQIHDYLHAHIGWGKIAKFTRQAIIEKLAHRPPALGRLLSAVEAMLPIIEELMIDNDVGKAECLALREAFRRFDK